MRQRFRPRACRSPHHRRANNFSTHTATAFYENFSAEVARKLARRIEFCCTPVHGSWLKMVEVEISVMVRQCLGRRLQDHHYAVWRACQARAVLLGVHPTSSLCTSPTCCCGHPLGPEAL